MSVRVCILSSFFSFPFFLPLPFLNTAASPFFQPFFPTIHHGASNHHLSNQIHNIHRLFFLYLIFKFIFLLEIFFRFSNRHLHRQILTTMKRFSKNFHLKSTFLYISYKTHKKKIMFG